MSYWGSHYSGLREQAQDGGGEEGQEDAQTMELVSLIASYHCTLIEGKACINVFSYKA